MTNTPPLVTPIARIDSAAVENSKYKSITYNVDMPADMTAEQLLNPQAWIHVKRKFPELAARNRIECIKEDMSLFVELLVTGVSNDIIFVKILREVDLDDKVATKEESAYEIIWKVSTKKFAIVRKSDKEELRSGFTAKAEALECLKNNY